MAVDTSPERLVEQTKTSPHLRHYALLDPALLVTPGDDKKKLAYLLTWLPARPTLLYHLQKQDSTALSNQAWRDFLEMGHSDKLKNDTAAATRRAEIRKILRRVLETAGVSEASDNANSGPVYWRDEALALDKLPRISMFQEILWELYELNFRLELVSLDQRANRDPVKVDPDIRVQQILRCFPNTSAVSVITIPYANTGLVANDWRERLPFVLAFVNVMSCWEGLKPKVFNY